MLEAIILFAAEEGGEHNQTAFYVAGILAAVWAVVLAFFGMSREKNWPGTKAAARGVMAISAVLVFAAMATAVITA